jgi:signal peptidase I
MENQDMYPMENEDISLTENPETVPVPDEEQVEQTTEIPSEDTAEPQQAETAETKDSKKKKKNKKNAKKGALSYLHDFVIWLIIIVLVFLLLFRVAVVSGPSMLPTLTDGDYLLLLSSVFYRNPEPGDVIVVSTKEYNNGEPIIKRVIATAGQTVNIDFAQGIVYVDGKELNEPYVLSPTYLNEGMSFPYTVPKNCVFVMGDNRNNSMDSRNPSIGAVDKREILGKVILLMIPGRDPETGKRDWHRFGAVD